MTDSKKRLVEICKRFVQIAKAGDYDDALRDINVKADKGLPFIDEYIGDVFLGYVRLWFNGNKIELTTPIEFGEANLESVVIEYGAKLDDFIARMPEVDRAKKQQRVAELKRLTRRPSLV